MQTDVPKTTSGAPRRRGKRVDEIIETLRQDIVTRKASHGERLLEREVSQRFGVSQPTAREAVRGLEMMGLVDVVHGTGAFIRSQGNFAVASALQTMLQLESVGFMEIFDVRQTLGRRSIELAACNATDEDIEKAAAFARFENVAEAKILDEVIAYVVRFQRAVSDASHSPLLQTLEGFLVGLLTELQFKVLSDRGVRFWRSLMMEFQSYRVDIVEALRSGDGAVARAAAERYFEAQRAMFERDTHLRELNLSSPNLINVVTEMVRRFKE